MDIFIEILKAILFGIVEGITEWLPISSTGHMILLDELVSLKVSAEFYEMFQVVIQLGAILAVILLFFHKLNPFSPKREAAENVRGFSALARRILTIFRIIFPAGNAGTQKEQKGTENGSGKKENFFHGYSPCKKVGFKSYLCVQYNTPDRKKQILKVEKIPEMSFYRKKYSFYLKREPSYFIFGNGSHLVGGHHVQR